MVVFVDPGGSQAVADLCGSARIYAGAGVVPYLVASAAPAVPYLGGIDSMPAHGKI